MGKARHDRIVHMDEGTSSAEHETSRMFDHRNEAEFLKSVVDRPLSRTSRSTLKVGHSAVNCSQDIATGGEVEYLHSRSVAVQA